MALSRRSFVHTVGAGAAGLVIAGRGREGAFFGDETLLAQSAGRSILISSNENPLGCHPDVLAAVKGSMGEAGRYAFAAADEVTALVAKRHNVKPENVLLGAGSTQILRTSTEVFTTKTAGLVAAVPAYEECASYARLIGHPVTGVKLNAQLKMDLDALQAAAKGAGLVFYCNPNNPVATAVSAADTRQFLSTLMKQSPDTTVLVDEAYFEYVTMPGYETMVPLAVENPRVVVARTFSKCYGMAGLRIGYAVGHKDTIAKMGAWDGIDAISVMALQGAKAALAVPAAWVKSEQARNAEARAFTMKWFTDRGYQPTDSQTNFMFIDIKRPSKAFREACARDGVLIGCDFPPYEQTHARISVGTLAEMQRAVKVFEQVLATPAQAAAA
ncbi:MAG TPA: aminotransferase class I/II-fold pyridoxal phosphate-dependent enzyme [Vicinamibacterales bacterium]|nr:aminotransferase class I/II-fold pyridoxal phosphate-dependent enzyme [Vicinamibacterales bacterium]